MPATPHPARWNLGAQASLTHAAPLTAGHQVGGVGGDQHSFVRPACPLHLFLYPSQPGRPSISTPMLRLPYVGSRPLCGCCRSQAGQDIRYNDFGTLTILGLCATDAHDRVGIQLQGTQPVLLKSHHRPGHLLRRLRIPRCSFTHRRPRTHQFCCNTAPGPVAPPEGGHRQQW